MIKRLVIGPGAMGAFLYLGFINHLKKSGHIEDLDAISGASAGGLIGFLFCLFKGETTKLFDYILSVPVSKIMKPNVKTFLKDWGLVSSAKIRKTLSEVILEQTGKPDITFMELFQFFPIKLYISAYCVDFMKTDYFSVDSHPTTSVIDAVCATVAIPFLVSAVKIGAWRYIDGGAAESAPGAPFLGMDDVFMIQLAWGKLSEIKDIKSYALGIVYSTMSLRANYDLPRCEIEVPNIDIYDFNTSNDGKLKLFLSGYDQACKIF